MGNLSLSRISLYLAFHLTVKRTHECGNEEILTLSRRMNTNPHFISWKGRIRRTGSETEIKKLGWSLARPRDGQRFVIICFSAPIIPEERGEWTPSQDDAVARKAERRLRREWRT